MSKIVPVLELANIHHTFQQAGETLNVLKGVSLKINPGELVALVGPSGAGKSTLLQICGLLEHPTSGQLYINGSPAENLNDSQRTALRRKDIGFVYQFHNLLADFTALENVVMPQIIDNVPLNKAKEVALKLIEQMGLSHRVDHRPAQLSGGEAQRIAIARALANGPKLLLADEPTGNLDTKTAGVVFEEFVSIVKNLNVGALIATHNPELAARMDRTLHVIDGKLVEA